MNVGREVKILLLNNRGISLDALEEQLRGLGARVDLVEPESTDGPLPVSGYDGVVASGGYLKSDVRSDTLRKYSAFFDGLSAPFLGICLGMKILGYCYGARIARTSPVVGVRRVALSGFPLFPGFQEFAVHQNHRYELVRPLPSALQDFTADGGPVQAIGVKGKRQYAVQFHPEVGRMHARVILENFVSLSSQGAQVGAQGT